MVYIFPYFEVTILRKRKQKDLNKVPKLPILILFVVELLFIGVLQTSKPVPIYEQLGELTICFWAIYIVILFFNFINKMVNKIPETKEKIKKLKNVLLVVAEVCYILLQLYFILAIAISSFAYNLKILSQLQFTYSFGNIGVLLVVAICLLVYRSFVSQKQELKAVKTISSICLILGGISFVYIGFCVLNIVLEMDFSNMIFWFYRIATIYIACVLFFDLFISVIKRETLKDFNYTIYLPDIKKLKNKDNEEKKSLVDTLEKHTGISLKSLWSIKYVTEILPSAVLVLLVVLLVASCVYKVEPYEKAAVYRFGSLEETSIKGAGLHLKLPWPVEKAEIYEVDRVQNMTIGYESNDTMDNMWTESHSVEEYKLLTGNGNELVSVNIKLIYKIDDLYTYLTVSSNPEAILSSKAYEFMMNKTNSTDLDTILSVDRTGLSKELLSALNEFTKEYKVGLSVEEVIIESIHPPVELSSVYQSVVSADVKKTTTITNAEAEAEKLILNAEKEAKTVVVTAKENQSTKVSDATKEMTVYKAAFEEYRKRPAAFKLSKYVDAYEKVIAGNKVYVFSPNIDSELSQYIINSTGKPLSSEQTTVIEAEE